MKFFFTKSCTHLASGILGSLIFPKVEYFSDGELSVHIRDNVENETVWVIGSTPAPADNILELCFIIDALIRSGGRVNVLITYFGYARQDRPFNGQPLSAAVVTHFFEQFDIERFLVLHMHNPTFASSLPYTSAIYYDFFVQLAQDVDIIVAPDHGATYLAQAVAQRSGKQAIFLNKVRQSPDDVEIKFDGDLREMRTLIVDDMITTANTMTQAAHILKDAGAQYIIGAATHGVFSGDARELIRTSPLEKVYVTNSLPQHDAPCDVISLSPFINMLVAN